MNEKLKKTILISGSFFVLGATDAFSEDATPLQSSNQIFLCDHHVNQNYVVPEKLYSEMLELAKVPTFLIGDTIRSGKNFEDMILDDDFPQVPQGDANKIKEIDNIKKLKKV